MPSMGSEVEAPLALFGNGGFKMAAVVVMALLKSLSFSLIICMLYIKSY